MSYSCFFGNATQQPSSSVPRPDYRNVIMAVAAAMAYIWQYGIWHMASWWLQWPQIGLWIRTWGGQRKSVLLLPFTFQLRTGWSHGTPNQNGQVSTSCESWTVQTSNVEKKSESCYAALLCHANVTVSMSSSIVYDTMPLCHCATTACHEMLAASSSCCDMSHVLQSAFHGTQGLRRPMTDLRPKAPKAQGVMQDIWIALPLSAPKMFPCLDFGHSC